MKKTLQNLWLFCLVFTVSVLSQCPAGFDQLPTGETCVAIFNEPKFYVDAIRKCHSVGAISAKIENIFQNSYFFALLPSKTNNTAPYIGIEKKPSGAWTYADGTPLVYQNWNSGEPKTMSNTSICAVMDPLNGKWNTAECSFVRPFACSINHDDAQCPDEWVYFQQYCYYLRNFTLGQNNKWVTYLPADAEEECTQADAHLASIHSREEQEFLYDLVYSDVAALTSLVPDSNPCLWQWAFIGLSGTGNNDSTWTDGTPFDFFGYPAVVQSTFRYWAIVNDHSCGMWWWDVKTANQLLARFICKKSLKDLKRKRLSEQHNELFEEKAAKFGCPAGFEQFPEENSCFKVVSQPVYYVDAIRNCDQLGSMVVKIQNTLENHYLFGLLQTDADPQSPYIGIEKKPNGEWTYADGTLLVYQNWADGEPMMTSNSSICAIMDLNNGKWKTSECSTARPFICLFNEQANRCPYQWVYFEKTNSCYFLKNFTYDPLNMWVAHNFTSAEDQCSEMGGRDSHLVSVHSKEELWFVYDLIYSNVATMFNVAPKNDSCRYQTVWSGLYSDARNSGKWSDGSAWDFMAYPYQAYDGGDYLWVMQNDESCNVRGWVHADQTATRFVCKKPATNIFT